MSLSLRDARTADLPEILRLLTDDHLGRHRDSADEASDPAYLAALAAIDADPNNRLLVAERAGVIVGTLQLTFIPGLSNRGAWLAMIEAVRIDSALRGGGLGRQMMDLVFEICRDRGCASIALKSHRSRIDAHRFYEQLGFEHTHVGMSRPL